MPEYSQSCEDYMQNVIDWMNDHIGKPSEYDNFGDYYNDVQSQTWANNFENVIEHCKDTLEEMYEQLGGGTEGPEGPIPPPPPPPPIPPREIIYNVLLEREQKRRRNGRFAKGYNIVTLRDWYTDLQGRFTSYNPEKDLVLGAKEYWA